MPLFYVEKNCQANLYIALTRHTTGIGLGSLPYLENSTRWIWLGGDVRAKDVWHANPPGHGNRLFLDGRLIPNGIREFYSEDTCPNPESLKNDCNSDRALRRRR